MKYLLNSHNTVINSDHIVTVEYTPARSGIDDETGKPYSMSSKCKITLTSKYLEEDCGYEGAVIGVAAVSDYIQLYSEAADVFWAEYKSDALEVK